jgi:8-oxo-dGTP diphosphatase
VTRIWEPCAGGIVLNDAGRLLLIRRATPPSAGRWSIPGGRCRPGESTAAACVREVAEETGLVVRVVRRAGRVRRAGPDGVGYDIEDFVCSVDGGRLRAGDDADEARWVSHAQLASLDLVPGLLDALTSWDALPS